MKEDHDLYKEEAIELRRQLEESEKELEFQRKENQEKINEIEKQWIEFEEEMKGGTGSKTREFSDLRSEKSSLFNYKNKYDHLATQN